MDMLNIHGYGTSLLLLLLLTPYLSSPLLLLLLSFTRVLALLAIH